MSVTVVKGAVRARLLTEDPDGSRSAEERRARATALAQEEGPLLDHRERERVVGELLAEVEGLGPLEPLRADPAVTDILVNGPGPVWVERAGALRRLPIELDGPSIEHLIERIVGPLGLRVDRSSPLVDARLPDGSRVNAVVPPLAIDGPCLTIRRFATRAVGIPDFAPPALCALLAWAVVARMNILVSGGTGAGKTTLLNAMGALIPGGERVVTVEDAAELRLPGDHVVRLEARPPNAEGAGEVRVRDLVRNALRMRPDRIVVGEVRGGEAFDMLQAMNTGHDGSLSTCHANSADDALRRVETMVLMAESGLPLGAVRAQVHSAVDLVVQVARTAQGRRRVVAVSELEAEPDPGGGRGTALLAVSDRVLALPRRPARSPWAPAPDPRWVGG